MNTILQLLFLLITIFNGFIRVNSSSDWLRPINRSISFGNIIPESTEVIFCKRYAQTGLTVGMVGHNQNYSLDSGTVFTECKPEIVRPFLSQSSGSTPQNVRDYVDACKALRLQPDECADIYWRLSQIPLEWTFQRLTELLGRLKPGDEFIKFGYKMFKMSGFLWDKLKFLEVKIELCLNKFYGNSSGFGKKMIDYEKLLSGYEIDDNQEFLPRFSVPTSQRLTCTCFQVSGIKDIVMGDANALLDSTTLDHRMRLLKGYYTEFCVHNDSVVNLYPEITEMQLKQIKLFVDTNGERYIVLSNIFILLHHIHPVFQSGWFQEDDENSKWDFQFIYSQIMEDSPIYEIRAEPISLAIALGLRQEEYISYLELIHQETWFASQQDLCYLKVLRIIISGSFENPIKRVQNEIIRHKKWYKNGFEFVYNLQLLLKIYGQNVEVKSCHEFLGIYKSIQTRFQESNFNFHTFNYLLHVADSKHYTLNQIYELLDRNFRPTDFSQASGLIKKELEYKLLQDEIEAFNSLGYDLR